MEAAQSLGMTRLLTMRRIVLPQAMRVIIPPTGNETISMLKTTSLLAVIGGVVGVLAGAAATAVYASFKSWAVVIPVGAWVGGIAAAILIGAFAGVYLGAYLYTWWSERDSGQAHQAGIGAFMADACVKRTRKTSSLRAKRCFNCANPAGSSSKMKLT